MPANKYYSNAYPVLAAADMPDSGPKLSPWDAKKVGMIHAATADKPGSPKNEINIEEHSKNCKSCGGFDGWGHAYEFSNKMYQAGYRTLQGKPGDLKFGKSGRYDDHTVVVEHGDDDED